MINKIWRPKPKNCAGPVWRYDGNPIIGRNPFKGAARIFNSGVAEYNGKYAGIFRADGTNGVPHIYYGESADGINWSFDTERIKFSGGQNPGYSYDPRLVKIDDTYYIIWCTDIGAGWPTLGLASTKDFKRYERYPHGFLPFNRNGVLFPEKINGQFVMLSRPSDNAHTPFGDIYLSESPDLFYWGNHKHVMSKNPCGEGWSSLKIGAGPAPIKTKEGWLLLFHGAVATCSGYVYSMGAALLDLKDPSKVVARGKDYLLTPEAPYEETGFVPNVVFPCGELHDKEGRLVIYYGAADTCLCLAFSKTDEILNFLRGV